MAEPYRATPAELAGLAAAATAEDRGLPRAADLARAYRPGEHTTPPQLPRHEPSGWARHFLDAVRGQQVPEYRSPEWDALPDNDPRKVAACVQAAERYAAATSPAAVADRLAQELAAGRVAQQADERRLADALGWAAGTRERAEGLAAGTGLAARAAIRPGPDQFAPPTPVRDSPGWPPVVQPGQAGRTAAAVQAAVQGGTRATWHARPGARQAARTR